MRAFASFLLVLSAPLALAQSITCSTAQPVSRLVEELAKQSGLDLLAAANVRNDVVVLACKNAKPDEVMARVAAVLHAQWTKSGTHLILSRDSNLVSLDERAEQAANGATLRTMINNLMSGIQADGPFTQDKAKKYVADNEAAMDAVTSGGNGSTMTKFAKTMTQSAGSRAIIRMLAAMSDSDLAILSTGRRVVFTNRPTRMQRQLPNGAFAAAQAFVREQQMIAAATPPPAANGERRVVINGFSDSRLGSGNPTDLATVMLILNDTGSPGRSNGSARLVVADSKGQTICSGNFAAMPGTPASAPTKAPASPEKPITLTPLTQEFDKVMAQATGNANGPQRMMIAVANGGPEPGGAGGSFAVSLNSEKAPQITMSPELRKAILRPETVEPASFSVEEGLTALAPGKNFCAYVPDGSIVRIARYFNGGERTPNAFRDYTDRTLGWQWSEEGNWTLVQPRKAFSARAERVNRLALSTLLRTMSTKSALTLADVSAFAAAQPKAPGGADIDLAYAVAISPSVASEAFVPLALGSEWPMVRFYGLLSDNQRQALLSKTRLLIRNLTPDQVGALSEQVFQSSDGPSRLEAGALPAKGMRFTLFGSGVDEERTFLMPGGLPNDGYVTLEAGSEGILQSQDADGTSRSITADQLAFNKYQAEHPETFAGFGEGPQPVPSSFRPARQTQYTLELVLAENYGLRRSVEDTAIGNGGYVAYDQLPHDVKDKVEQKLQALRQGMRGGSFGPGGKVPPPTR